MYGIGLVARLAQVSVRTLRHYDNLGLLKPSHVDPLTGYRYYTPDQVLRLHRILVLRDLGVPLAQIGRLLDDDVTVEQLRGILRLRQAEARARLAAQSQQLRRVEIRLAQLEEASVADYDVIMKRLEPMRVVALTEELESYDQIGAACDRMYPRLQAALAQRAVPFEGLSIAQYEETGDESWPLRITTALPVPADVTIEDDGLATIELAAVERAATTVVRGDPAQFAGAFRALHEWVDQTGAQATVFERELYIDCDGPRDTWVTELQVLMEPANDRQYYARHTRVTEPGMFADRVMKIPGSLTAMRSAARQLVFHYRAGGDYAANGIAPDRITEIDTRYARDMLARIFELSDLPLSARRAPNQRLVGCCRDFTVLFLTIARAHGVPARARVGFATYFEPGWYIDHVVADVWDADLQRWRMVDAELADNHVDPADGTLLDPENLTVSQFVTGPVAWLACRSGRADPARHVVDPGLDIPATRGWPYVRHNLIHDLAAISGREMLLWDNWGWTDPDADLTPEQLAVLDELATRTSRDATIAQVNEFYVRDGLRVPGHVTSYSPAHQTPLRVTL